MPNVKSTENLQIIIFFFWFYLRLTKHLIHNETLNFTEADTSINNNPKLHTIKKVLVQKVLVHIVKFVTIFKENKITIN